MALEYAQLDPADTGSFGSLLQQILGQMGGMTAPSYSDLLNQGVNSPLLQAVLGPALQNLNLGADTARTGLTDEFRKAGALGGGAHGSAKAKLETGIQGQQGNLISQVISSMLPQMTQGLNQQWQNQMDIPKLLATVLGQTRPNVLGGFPPQQGQGGGGSSGGAGGGGGSTAYGGRTGVGMSPGNSAANDPYWQSLVKGGMTDPFRSYSDQGGGGSGDLSGFDLGGMNSDPYGEQATMDAWMATFNQGGGGFQVDSNQFQQQPLQYNYGDGFTSQDNSMYDQWGYSDSDWASDEYYS